MTKTQAALARFAVQDECALAMAYLKGRLARTHNRPQTGELVPKFETPEETAAFENGWQQVDDVLDPTPAE